MTVIVQRLRMCLDRLLGVGRRRTAADVPGPVEHRHRFVFTHRADVFIREGFASERVGKHPGIRQHFMGVDQAVSGDNILFRRRMVLAVRLRHAGLERFFRLFSRKHHLQFKVQLVLHAVFVAKPVLRIVFRPVYAFDARLACRFMYQKQILSRALRIVREHKLASASVFDRVVEFGGNRLRRDRRFEVLVPAV